MRILFDQGTPVPLRRFLGGHSVEAAYERGWSTLGNGELLTAAEDDGFDCFVTTDRQLKHHQNLEHRHVAIIVLTTPSWPRIRRAAQSLVPAVENAAPGRYFEVTIP